MHGKDVEEQVARNAPSPLRWGYWRIGAQHAPWAESEDAQIVLYQCDLWRCVRRFAISVHLAGSLARGESGCDGCCGRKRLPRIGYLLSLRPDEVCLASQFS